MSHFLTHLVQRTLGEHGAIVAPRPASRFEPVEAAEPFASTEPAAAGSAVEKAAMGALRGHRRRQVDAATQPFAQGDGSDGVSQLQVLAQRLAQLDGLLAEQRRSTPPAGPSSVPTPARRGAGNADDLGPGVIEATVGGPPSETRAAARRAAEQQNATKISPARMLENSQPQTAAQALIAPAAQSRGEQEADAASGKDARTEAQAQRQSPRPSTREAGIAIAPEVSLTNKAGTTRRRARQPRPSAEGSETRALTPAPAVTLPTPASVLAPQSVSQKPMTAARNRTAAEITPTINVTIGRIEVRAMPAPPQPVLRKAARPATAQPSAMSLDEYLRRRNGGTP